LAFIETYSYIADDISELEDYRTSNVTLIAFQKRRPRELPFLNIDLIREVKETSDLFSDPESFVSNRNVPSVGHNRRRERLLEDTILDIASTGFLCAALVASLVTLQGIISFNIQYITIGSFVSIAGFLAGISGFVVRRLIISN
jgi:hypothetical protein